MTLLQAVKEIFLLKTFVLNIVKVASTVGGWLVATLTTIVMFFAAEKYSFYIVLAAILFDALFGIMVSVRNGRFALSKLGRVTSFKIISYGLSLVMVYMIERLAHDTGMFGIKIAAAWAVACEFWSMSGSILILWPDAPFFKIMRRHLKGEIAAKLGTDIEDLLPENKV